MLLGHNTVCSVSVTRCGKNILCNVISKLGMSFLVKKRVCYVRKLGRLSIVSMSSLVTFQLISMFKTQAGIKGDDAEFIILSTHVIWHTAFAYLLCSLKNSNQIPACRLSFYFAQLSCCFNLRLSENHRRMREQMGMPSFGKQD